MRKGDAIGACGRANAAPRVTEPNAQRRRGNRRRENGATCLYVRINETVIEVRDTGSGIPLAQLQKIFIPFFTTKAKGHGVGLALTHRIITQHGGTLTAANSPEGGAIFTII